MIFTNATVITMNPLNQIISQGAVAIEGDRIVAVGKAQDLAEQYPHKRVSRRSVGRRRRM